MISISVGNFSIIDPEPAKRRYYPMVRFGVTISKDATPLWTSLGWRIMVDRTIWPPSVRAAVGRSTAFHEIDQRFLDMIRDSVLSYPAVVKALGPFIDIEAEKKNRKKKDVLPVEPKVVMEDEG